MFVFRLTSISLMVYLIQDFMFAWNLHHPGPHLPISDFLTYIYLSLLIAFTILTRFFSFLFKQESSALINFFRSYIQLKLYTLKKIRNSSRFCLSSLSRGHVALLCIIPVLVYVLPKWALLTHFQYITFVIFYMHIDVFCVLSVIRLQQC